MRIASLKPGTRFVHPETGMRGTLVHANECRARVRIDGTPKLVKLPNGREFISSGAKDTDWSPNTQVRIERD